MDHRSAAKAVTNSGPGQSWPVADDRGASRSDYGARPFDGTTGGRGNYPRPDGNPLAAIRGRTKLRIWHQTTNLGVRSSNLFGRAR
jgi:hypothetical protein